DGYRQNSDPETMDPTVPRPMFSLKVAYVLSDLSETGRGATKVIPGSHLWNSLPRPADTTVHNPDPEGTVEITANPGDCFIFDRRLWHSRSPNYSDVTRKMLFVGYTYRWIRNLDDMPIDFAGKWWADRTPVQRQICGEDTHTDRGQGDLDQQLEPVDTVRLGGDAKGTGDHGTQQSSDDTDDHGEP